MLIEVDQSMMRSYGLTPILADSNNLPVIQMGDAVCIIQHPGGMQKHFSQDTVKRVNKPFVEYYADTLNGSSGSPVFVVQETNFLLAALHSNGVESSLYNWNKGVLLADILDHLHTGKGNIYRAIFLQYFIDNCFQRTLALRIWFNSYKRTTF